MVGLGFGGFGFILMILFWVVIIGLAVWLISRVFPQTVNFTSSQSGGSYSETFASPDEILKRRYAQGEITKAEYEEMRQDLRE